MVACWHEPTCGGDDITVSVAPAPQLEPYGGSQQWLPAYMNPHVEVITSQYLLPQPPSLNPMEVHSSGCLVS